MGPHDSETLAVRQVLAKAESTDQLLALDARHTPHETLQQILDDHGADSLVPVKDNQPAPNAHRLISLAIRGEAR
jgi:hypothetical protein